MRELETELCTMQLGSLHEDWLTGYPGLCCVTGGDATLPSRGLSLREAAERVWLTPGDEGGAECRLSPEMGQSLLSFSPNFRLLQEEGLYFSVPSGFLEMKTLGRDAVDT